MNKQILFLCLWIIGFTIVGACSNVDNGDVPEISDEDLALFYDPSLKCIQEETTPNLTIREGFVSQEEQVLRIVREGEAVALVKLGKPTIIAQAEQEYDWGFFQFPKIFRAEDGSLLVKWQMKQDSPSAYGIDSYGRMVSKDEGITWGFLNEKFLDREQYYVEFSNGNILQIKDPTTKPISSFNIFPSPVNAQAISNHLFYYESELPEELKGAYLEYWDKNSRTVTTIHAKLDDPGLLRYSVGDEMPIVWWGDIREDKDGSLVSGIYPGYYQNTQGEVLNYGVSFYRSEDRGYNWKIIGKIPYQRDGLDPEALVYDGSESFSEPSFEILGNGKYVCVMRTGFTSPLYIADSNDYGKHWSVPHPFTPNGVKPSLMSLGNGVLALASGRPGIQLRFNLDGDGKIWTEPIEMLPYVVENGSYTHTIRLWETCGYASLLEVDNHTFYMVYSDFKQKDSDGLYRKAIIFRRVEIIRKNNPV